MRTLSPDHGSTGQRMMMESPLQYPSPAAGARIRRLEVVRKRTTFEVPEALPAASMVRRPRR